MSGGHFDYEQYHIQDIIDSIERYLDGAEIDDPEYYIKNYFMDPQSPEANYIREHGRTIPNTYEFGEETLKEFRKGLEVLKKAYVYSQRIDWLLSGDDGEDSFHERLKEELNELKQ